MTGLRLYIAGPMSGLPDSNRAAFYAAAVTLTAHGYEVENPAANQPSAPDPEWVDYMRMSLVQIARCDGIASLPGAHASRGARLECVIADGLGLPVRTVAEWIA